MTTLDADAIHALLDDDARVTAERLETFAEIDSTNSYLMGQPHPQPGCMRIAATLNQTAGRGRHGKTWLSPAGSGLCVSMAYTFASRPENLPALTLAIGLGAIEALQCCEVRGVMLKWPNDLVFDGGKLGGILTEAHAHGASAISIVTGIGINIDGAAAFEHELGPDRLLPPVDLRGCGVTLSSRDQLTAHLVRSVRATLVEYEAGGFASFLRRWRTYDWLQGRQVSIETQGRLVAGTAAGIGEDGALLVVTDNDERQRITSGSVVVATTTGKSR